MFLIFGSGTWHKLMAKKQIHGFGSDLDPVIFAQFLFKCAWCTRWAGLTILGYSICPREFRVAEMSFSTTLNLPAPVLIVPLS